WNYFSCLRAVPALNLTCRFVHPSQQVSDGERRGIKPRELIRYC
ncbi:MAG: hypothetical protein JWM04_2356, partial [Verrucomicrobiales bacterium]|nr:hypothetical protein [Verrucomicrobiales bacterium]